MDVITVQHLSKRFGAVTVVDGISFTVTAGEIVGFLGPNGAGKTTTLAMLLGLLLPTSGEVRVLDLAMPAERQRILARVNFTSPYVALPGNLPCRSGRLTRHRNVIVASVYGLLSTADFPVGGRRIRPS